MEWGEWHDRVFGCVSAALGLSGLKRLYALFFVNIQLDVTE